MWINDRRKQGFTWIKKIWQVLESQYNKIATYKKHMLLNVNLEPLGYGVCLSSVLHVTSTIILPDIHVAFSASPEPLCPDSIDVPEDFTVSSCIFNVQDRKTNSG